MNHDDDQQHKPMPPITPQPNSDPGDGGDTDPNAPPTKPDPKH